jgi:hypothetical protein
MSRTQAENLLVHYLRTVWEKAGLRWEGDNDAEVRSIVDALAEVATEAANHSVRQHQENAPHLYPDGSSS